MTKEDILRSYLEDELLVEKGHLKEGEAHIYKWTNPANSDLVHILKIAIESEIAKESSTVAERKINQFLNKQ